MAAVDKDGKQFTFTGPLGVCHYPGKACGLTPAAWLMAVTKQAGCEIDLQEANRQAYGWTEADAQETAAHNAQWLAEMRDKEAASCRAVEKAARERALGLGQTTNAGLEQLASAGARYGSAAGSGAHLGDMTAKVGAAIRDRALEQMARGVEVPESPRAERLSVAFDKMRGASKSGTWGQLIEQVVLEEIALTQKEAVAGGEARSGAHAGCGHGIPSADTTCDQCAGYLKATAIGGPRKFTREEVLTVLRAQRATWREERTETGGIRFRAACEALGDAMGVFERME